MLITLAVIGALAVFVCFIRALGLKRINVEFDRGPINWPIPKSVKDNENRPKQLKD
jgi:hypothetical protein